MCPIKVHVPESSDTAPFFGDWGRPNPGHPAGNSTGWERLGLEMVCLENLNPLWSNLHFLYLGLTQKEPGDARPRLGLHAPSFEALTSQCDSCVRVCVLASAWAAVSFSSFQAQHSDGTQ